MELAVVLAIIAVLAAVLTPVVINYVDQARTVRATADVKVIADGIRLYQRDTGRFPIYTSNANGNSDTAAATLLTGPGNSHSATNHADWAAFTTTTDLAGQLNVNLLGLSTGSQVSSLGRIAYRGPYIAAIDTDPWGSRYVVTATNLRRASNDWAFVISAGLDGELDSDPTQANTTAFAVLGDDIVAIIK